MSVQLSMLPLMMSEASLNATGSPESVGGHAHFASPDGMTTNPSGPDHPRASLSAPQDSSAAAPTNGTLPHTSPSSSPASDRHTSSESKSPARLSSESLQKALEKRLQANLNGLGSMIYSGAWKLHTTPAERQIYRLRASARRISASEHSSSASGWPTPDTCAGGTGPSQSGRNSMRLQDASETLTGWPTPQARDWKDSASAEALERAMSAEMGSASVPRVAVLTGWPTPCASDNRDRGKWDDPAIQRRKEIGKSIELTMLVGVAGWPTPHLNSVTGAGSDGRAGGLNIQTAVHLAGWTTPQAHDTSGRSLGQKAIHGTKHGCACLVRDAEISGWNTPRATDGSHGGPNQAGGALSADAAIAGWKTPCTPNGGRSMSTERMDATGRTLDGKKHTASLEHEVKFSDGPARLLADGTILTGFSAEMESGGQLNPRFSGWLMGYPPEWCEAAISCQLATPSRKKAKPTPDAP